MPARFLCPVVALLLLVTPSAWGEPAEIKSPTTYAGATEALDGYAGLKDALDQIIQLQSELDQDATRLYGPLNLQKLYSNVSSDFSKSFSELKKGNIPDLGVFEEKKQIVEMHLAHFLRSREIKNAREGSFGATVLFLGSEGVKTALTFDLLKDSRLGRKYRKPKRLFGGPADLYRKKLQAMAESDTVGQGAEGEAKDPEKGKMESPADRFEELLQASYLSVYRSQKSPVLQIGTTFGDIDWEDSGSLPEDADAKGLLVGLGFPLNGSARLSVGRVFNVEDGRGDNYIGITFSARTLLGGFKF